MIVLGIGGSPRRGGNTDILLDRALDGASSRGAATEKIVINDLKFAPCQECAVVNDDGTCRVEDPFQLLYRKIKDADVVILASPVFFGSVSAQTKTMIDRFQCHWRAKYIRKIEPFAKRKRAAFICVEASTRKDFVDNAKSVVRNLFVTINAAYQDELVVSGIDEKGKIREHPDALTKAFELGSRIASV